MEIYYRHQGSNIKPHIGMAEMFSFLFTQQYKYDGKHNTINFKSVLTLQCYLCVLPYRTDYSPIYNDHYHFNMFNSVGNNCKQVLQKIQKIRNMLHITDYISKNGTISGPHRMYNNKEMDIFHIINSKVYILILQFNYSILL